MLTSLLDSTNIPYFHVLTGQHLVFLHKYLQKDVCNVWGLFACHMQREGGTGTKQKSEKHYVNTLVWMDLGCPRLLFVFISSQRGHLLICSLLCREDTWTVLEELFLLNSKLLM